MESQRLNALNQAYETQQRAAMERQQQPPQNQQNAAGRDINQIPPRTWIPNAAPIYTGINRPLATPLDRNFIVEDLRRQGQIADEWRVVNQEGRWWYWAPNSTWLYYDNGSWNTYERNEPRKLRTEDGSPVDIPAGYADENWRLVRHNNRWWFWTPNETWMYFRDGRWNDYRVPVRDAAPLPVERNYDVGYRGEEVLNRADQSAVPSVDKSAAPTDTSAGTDTSN